MEAFMDAYRIGRYRDQVYHQAAFPQELGWIALLARVDYRRLLNASYAATTPDEMEFQMNRALGFDLPISLETNLEEMRENGFTNEIMAVIGQYEKLRLSYRVPAGLAEKLQRPDVQFIQQYGLLKEQYRLDSAHFRPGKASCKFRRQAYLEKVLSPGDPPWVFTNPFHPQQLKVKITALPSHHNFGSDQNHLIFDKLDSSFINHDWGPAVKKENIVVDPDGQLIVTNVDGSYLRKYWWCGFRKVFATILDLSEHKVMELTASGDGKEEVVCLQLFDEDGMQRLFQFVVDFSDTRQIHFDLPTGAAFYDHQPLFGPVYRYFKWSRVQGMEIYVKNIPTGSEGMQIRIRSMKALKQEYLVLKNPSLELDEKKVSFPAILNPRDCTLGAEPWDFLMYDGATFDRFNGNNQRCDNGIHDPIYLPDPAMAPMVKSGENQLFYEHHGKNKALVRILLEDHAEKWLFHTS